MATISPTITQVGKQDGSSYAVIWTPVTEADTCSPVQLPEYSDKSVVVTGTFGSATLAIHGSNDGTNYAPLHDPGGTVIGITAASGGSNVRAILENTVYLKPVTSGGTSSSLTVGMLFHLSNPMRT